VKRNAFKSETTGTKPRGVNVVQVSKVGDALAAR